MAGYHNGWKASGVLDAQSVRAVYLEAGGKAVLLIVIDCIGLASDHVDEITGRLPENLRGIAHVVSTHTHAGADTLGLWGPVEYGTSGPVSIQDGKDSALMTQLIGKAAEAGAEAYEVRGRGDLFYSVTDKGIENFQYDSRQPRCYDVMLHQLRFAREDGEPGIRIMS